MAGNAAALLSGLPSALILKSFAAIRRKTLQDHRLARAIVPNVESG
jgi:hypothetical protein